MTDYNPDFRLVYKEKEYSCQELLLGNTSLVEDELFEKVRSFLRIWAADDAYISQQTSGSTGQPKTIRLLKKHMIASATATIDKLSLKTNDPILLAINPDFIGGKMMIIRALIGGMKLVLGQVSAKPFTTNNTNYPIAFFSFVPYQLKQMLDSEEYLTALNKAKAIILGGAPVSEALHRLIKGKISAKVYSTYGMTETVSHIALKLLNTEGETTYFEALAGVTFSKNENDCLVIHASHITGLKSLPTNDVVDLIDAKRFEWRGRFDFTINSGGVKIQAEQLENAIQQLLLQHNLSNRILIFALPDEALGQKIALLIEGEHPIKGIKGILATLPKYHIPKQIYYLQSLVCSKSEKVDRKASIAAALQ